MSAVAVSREYEPSGRAASRVLIADDHPLILAGIRRTLERSDDIEIVGEAASAAQVIGLVERRRPEILLLDLHMPGANGSDLIETIHRDWPSVRIIILSASDERSAIDGALGAGASAYILKSVNPVDLPSVIRQVASGSMILAPARPAAASEVASSSSAAPDLTDRERMILSAISSGRTTAAISRELWVSEHTVKFHLTNIYRKLGVSNRAGAIRFAMEHGLAA
jgi:DNA-binding NarL/FixJ family response regulator